MKTTTQEKSKMKITRETIKELSLDQLKELVRWIDSEDRIILLSFSLFNENSFNKEIPWTISKINRFISRYYTYILDEIRECSLEDFENFEEEWKQFEEECM